MFDESFAMAAGLKKPEIPLQEDFQVQGIRSQKREVHGRRRL